jgi:hypothetical protein
VRAAGSTEGSCRQAGHGSCARVRPTPEARRFARVLVVSLSYGRSRSARICLTVMAAGLPRGV